MDTKNTMPSGTPDSQPPQSSKLMTKIVLGVAIVALGATAYFLSNAGLFQGRLVLESETEDANAQLALLGNSVEFPEGFAFQPPQAGGQKMTFQANEDIVVDLAPNKGNLRWMKADLRYDVNAGMVTVTNTSELHNTELMVVCVAFSGEEAAQCHSKFDNNLNQSFFHEYSEEGPQSFTFTIVDSYDNSDQIIKEFVVEGIEDDAFVEELPAPVVPLKLEVSEDVNGTVVVRDVTESYTEGVDQTRLYCDANINEQMDFYVHDDEVVDQFRNAKPLNVLRTDGVECMYPSNGTYNITYQAYVDGSHSGDARLVFPVTINHAEDLDEPVEPAVSVDAKISAGWETRTSFIVLDLTDNVDQVAYATLQCKTDGTNYVFSNNVLSAEDLGLVMSSIPNSEIASNFNSLVSPGFVCQYPDPGNEAVSYEITYTLFDAKSRVIGSANTSASLEAMFVERDPQVMPGWPVASIGLVPPNIDKVVRAYDESYNMGQVAYSKLDCGIEGEWPVVFDNRPGSDETLFDIATYGAICDYSAQPAGVYTIRYDLYNETDELIGHDEEQIEIVAEPLAFIPNLADYLQADVFSSSENAETIPAGAIVGIEFACSTAAGSFTIATTGDNPTVATFSIIPAETCGEEVAVTPTETPAQPAVNPPASGGGGGGSHSASELTTACEITPENPVAGQTVSFEASDSKLEVVNGSWDFGDDKDVYEFNIKKNGSADVEHIFDKAGKYKVKLTLKNTKKTYACKKTITVDEAAARVACNDGVDNDKDGFKDLDDPGCDDEDDKDEVNAIPRSGRQCNDGKDNDDDGFADLDDIGCQNAFDNDEVNPTDIILEGGDPAQQACLNKSDNNISFADMEESFAKDVIGNFATAVYDGEEADIKGDVIVRGYKTGSRMVFKGDQPIRRDEALKILSISSCLFEQSTAENNTQEVDYKDPEFSDKNYWARTFIYRAANQGIIKKAELMHPGDSVTRAEFAKMLTMVDKNIRGTKVERCERDEELAGDLDFTHWGCGYFKTLDQLGISGAIEDAKGNTRLYPNEILDRTSAVIWLNNYISVINQ